MKILLLEHPRGITAERCNDIANTPLSSCLLTGYAAGMLKEKGHEVKIVEGYLDGLSYEEIAHILEAFRPDILGVHMVYHWKKDEALFDFLARVKADSHAGMITAYGFYPSIAYRNILGECAAVESVILGEPELPFAALAGAASSTPSPAIPGLAVRNGSGEITHSPQRPLEDLDSLPFPVRTEALYRLPEINLLGSRGCYGKCTFCYIDSFYGGGLPWRFRSPENILQEITRIIAEKGAKDFYFTDPNFFGPGRSGQERARRIASLLKPLQIRFGIEGRVNDIHDETIGPLVEAGLRHILIGLESGKDDSLKRMNKMTTVAQNEAALRVLRKHGVEPNVGFIMFEPDSTASDIRINFEFLKRNDLLRNLSVTANVLYHHQIILEGTDAYHRLRREGRLETHSSSYEGTTCFRHQEVASLAELMREVTNFLFAEMEGIWSGKVIETPGAQDRYARVNRVLVDVFEANLGAIEEGTRPGREEIASIAATATGEINGILNPHTKP
jgi:radical SAM superfamily enzyme YgiQ (UPF0313 family)